MGLLFFLLYLIAAILFVAGIIKAFSGDLLIGIILIVLALLVGPGGTNLWGL